MIQNDAELNETIELLKFAEDALASIQKIVKNPDRLALWSENYIHHINILKSDIWNYTIDQRIDYLKTLKDGWLGDDQGKKPSQTGLDWLKIVLNLYYSKTFMLPRTYPTPDGNVQLEWTIADWDISLEIDLQNRTSELSSYNLKTQHLEEKILDLSELESWNVFNDFIEEKMKIN